MTPPVAHGIFLAIVIGWIVVEVRQSFRHRRGAIAASWGAELVFRLVVGAGAAAAIVFSRTVPAAAIGPVAAAAWLGCGLLGSGVALRVWSFRTLGRYFTFVVQTSTDQPVITAGPYRVIRHPSYAALLLAEIGVGLFIENWLSLISLTAAVAGGLVYRIRIEDDALLHDLDGYRDYAATHKRLIPYVW
jgi:protein-S-isoprenylcysteine O-methyltransferase Ste14